MDRFFASDCRDNNFILSKEDEHHLLHVLRHKKDDVIEIVYDEKLFIARIFSFNPLVLKMEKTLSRESELDTSLILAFSLLKGGHDELVIQKGTELGVKYFVPFYSSRTIVRLSLEEKEKRLTRFKKIARASAMQSRRLSIPSISLPLTFNEVLQFEATKKVVAYEELSTISSSLASTINELKSNESFLAVVGPEGGFSLEEIALTKKHGFKAISLGPSILRAETASIMIASTFLALRKAKEK